MASRRPGQSRASFPGLAFVLVGLCLSARGGFAAPPGLPDPSSGTIDGKMAIAVAPGKKENGKLEPLSPWGYQVHLTGYDDPSIDLVFPCGTWFSPPAGRYRTWIEGEWQVSPFSLVMSYSGQPFRGRGMTSLIPVADAGRVTLPAGVAKAPHLSLRVLHGGSYLEEKFPRWEVSRRKAVREVGEGLLMPVGPAIAALWDEKAQRYAAISRPFEVQARKTVTVSFEPAGGTHLVAQVQRHALASTAGDLPMEIVLRRQGRDILPDVKISMADRTYAVWYGLAPGPAELHARAGETSLDPQKLDLPAGKVERLLATLKAPLKLPTGR